MAHTGVPTQVSWGLGTNSLSYSPILCPRTDLSVAVLAGLRGGHLNDLAGSAFQHHMPVFAQGWALHGEGGRRPGIRLVELSVLHDCWICHFWGTKRQRVSRVNGQHGHFFDKEIYQRSGIFDFFQIPKWAHFGMYTLFTPFCDGTGIRPALINGLKSPCLHAQQKKPVKADFWYLPTTRLCRSMTQTWPDLQSCLHANSATPEVVQIWKVLSKKPKKHPSLQNHSLKTHD